MIYSWCKQALAPSQDCQHRLLLLINLHRGSLRARDISCSRRQKQTRASFVFVPKCLSRRVKIEDLHQDTQLKLPPPGGNAALAKKSRNKASSRDSSVAAGVMELAAGLVELAAKLGSK
ncbi:hypothetical protein Peur_033249 [Populus x canadensis]